MKRVRIVCMSPDPKTCRVTEVETGEVIPDVCRIDLAISPKAIVKAQITRFAEVDVVALAEIVTVEDLTFAITAAEIEAARIETEEGGQG